MRMKFVSLLNDIDIVIVLGRLIWVSFCCFFEFLGSRFLILKLWIKLVNLNFECGNLCVILKLAEL